MAVVRQARRPVIADCASCGAPFLPQRRDAVYCGVRCRVAAHRKRKKAELLVITPPPKRPKLGPVPAVAYPARVRPGSPPPQFWPCCVHCPLADHARHREWCRKGCGSERAVIRVTFSRQDR